jgi:hypothetical protein
LFSTWCAIVLSADDTKALVPATDPIPWGEVQADLKTAIVDDTDGQDLIGVEIAYKSDSFVIDSKGFKYDALVGIMVFDCLRKQYVLVDGTYFYQDKVVYTIEHNKEFVKPSSPVGMEVGYQLCKILRV